MNQQIQLILIVTSVLFFVYSSYIYLRILFLKSRTKTRRWWITQIVLISFYIIGYVTFLLYLRSEDRVVDNASLIIYLFFFGSIYVLNAALLTYNAIVKIVEEEEEEFRIGQEKIKERLMKELEEKTKETVNAKRQLERQHLALMNVLEDVTEEKVYGESQSRSILENTGEGVVVTNERGEVTYLNSAFSGLTGYTLADLKYEDFAEKVKIYDMQKNLIPVESRSDAAMLTAKSKKTKLLMARKDGKVAPVIVSATSINVEGEFRGVARIIHDYSEELHVQAQKDDFFSIASHELRTPLTVISGNISILTDTVREKLSDQEYKLVSDIEESADRLISMVNDFLNVSRLDQGE